MFETFGFEETTARQASVVFALALGGLFGLLAERTRFCFRRALVGSDRRAAAGVWFTALAVAIIGTQVAVALGFVSFDEHRFLSGELPIAAIVIGGLLFGAGMVLTRGCVARLTVLSGTGNLRAILVLLTFAIVAHAAMKGVFAPLRASLAGITLSLGDLGSLATLPGGALLWTGLIALPLLGIGLVSGNSLRLLAMAGLIGLLVPLGWVGTGFVLFDEFDPIAMESLSFTAPVSESLFWTIASTSISAGFGTGLIGGVVLGSLLAGLLFGSFQWQSFENARQTGRYLTGAALMGVGAVMAGGCTIGAGLSGIPTLSVSALLALGFIAVGAKVADRVLSAFSDEFSGSSTTPNLQPAE